jgi:5-methylcytosine-specific restriction endonuclease McrA
MGLKKPNHNNMKNIRKRLFALRGKKCERCGYGGYLEIHHIKEVINGGLDNEENLIILCQVCHDKAHGKVTKKFLDINRKYWMPGQNYG